MLAFDCARCPGLTSSDGTPIEGCADCLRRIAPGDPAGQWYQAPPAQYVGLVCPQRIGPEEKK